MNFFDSENLKLRIIEFVKFGAVGGIATAIHLLIYYLLQSIRVHYSIAYTCGYGISFIFNFFASNYFTFKTKPNKSSGLKFTLAHIFNYLLQIALLNIFVKIGISSNIAPILVFGIAVPINFILVRIALKNN